MKTKKPFGTILPPGSPLARSSVQRHSHGRKAVFMIVAVGVFGLALLLIGGCIHARHKADTAITAENNIIVSSATNTSAPDRLSVMVTNSQTRAPIVSGRPPVPSVAPVSAPKSAPLLAAQGATMKNYSVVSGDTFSKIAKANGVSVSALTKANPGVAPAKLKVWQELHIPVIGQQQTLPSSPSTHVPVKTQR